MPRVNEDSVLLGFFPASALSLHEALRPPGAEDARCVQPTSATQTNCVHPHPARSRLLTRLSSWGHPAESKALRGRTGGPNGSRRSDRFGGSTLTQLGRCSRPRLPRRVEPHGFTIRAWAFSSHGARIDRASDIPVASLPFTTPNTSPSCVLLRASPCWTLTRSVVMGELPRLRSAPPRDERCFR